MELNYVVRLVSNFKVEKNGPFDYILDSYYLPVVFKGYLDYPLICKPQLSSSDDPQAGYSPVQFTFTSDVSQAKKTVAESQSVPPATTTDASKPSTPTPGTPSPKGSTTADSPSQSAANPTSNTKQSSTPTGGSKSDSGATTAPDAPTSNTEQSSTTTGNSKSGPGATIAPVPPTTPSPNNIGVVVGGVVGGVGIITFIVVAVIFMRKFQRNREASPTSTESKRQSLNPFAAYRKSPKARTTGIFEKDGTGMVRELEGNPVGDIIRELEANTVDGRRKLQRNREASVGANGSNRWSFYPFGAESKARTTGIFEKDGNGTVRCELEANTVGGRRWSFNPFGARKQGNTAIFEKDGNGMVRELEANSVGRRRWSFNPFGASRQGTAVIFEKDGDGMARELEANSVGGRRWSFNPFAAYKRSPKARTTGIFEKDGDGMARELEANTVGGRMKYTMPRQSLVELPGDSSYYR